MFWALVPWTGRCSPAVVSRAGNQRAVDRRVGTLAFLDHLCLGPLKAGSCSLHLLKSSSGPGVGLHLSSPLLTLSRGAEPRLVR